MTVEDSLDTLGKRLDQLIAKSAHGFYVREEQLQKIQGKYAKMSLKELTERVQQVIRK